MILSVVIAAYNEGRYIARALASLEKQKLDFKDGLEIIVIDDGSTDNTTANVKRFAKVKLLHQDHKGVALARNLGVKYARGEIVIFLDADMEFEDDFMRKLVEPIKAKVTQGTFSSEEYVANWDNWVARCWNWDNDLPVKRRLIVNTPKLGSYFQAILKSEFVRVGGFDDIGYNDNWSLVAKLGYQPIDVEKAVFYHHNCASLKEAFDHAKWVSKRRYKLGTLGKLAALARVSFPVSIFLGIYKSARHLEMGFLIYKTVWDFGLALGMIEMWTTGKTKK